MSIMVSIIGAGAIGTALGKLINRQYASVNFLDKVEALNHFSNELHSKSFENGIAQSDVLFICIPSKHIRSLLTKITFMIKKDAIIICLAKGIEESSLKTMDLLLEEILNPSTKIGLMYGPMLASEINEGEPGFAHLAIKDCKAFETVCRIFYLEKLYLMHSKEIHSIALAGVLKNIYALAIGIADGLNFGNNTKGWLTGLAFSEMKGIIKKLSQLNEEVEISFLSDFVCTAFSLDSRNRLAGETIAKKNRLIESEGTIALPLIHNLLGTHSYLLLNALEEIFLKQKKSKITIENLICNPIYESKIN